MQLSVLFILLIILSAWIDGLLFLAGYLVYNQETPGWQLIAIRSFALGCVNFISNSIYYLVEYGALLSLIVLILLDYVLFKRWDKTKKAYEILIPFSIILASNLISGITVASYLNSIQLTPMTWMVQKPLNYIVLNVVAYFFIVLSLFLIRFISHSEHTRRQMNPNVYVKMMTGLIGIVFYLSFNMVIILRQFTRVLSTFEVYTYYCLTVFCGLIILYLTHTVARQEVYKTEYQQQLFYSEKLEGMFNELKHIQHGYNNLISTLQGYVMLEDWQQLDTFLNELVQNESCCNRMVFQKLKNIKNAGLFGLIFQKVEQMLKLKIDLKINIPYEVNTIPMRITEYTEIVGIILDNAIEAVAEKQEYKQISIEIYQMEDQLECKITNPIDAPPNIYLMFQKDWSTKGTGRGNGLWRVKNILRTKKHAYLNTEYENDHLIQTFIVQMNK